MEINLSELTPYLLIAVCIGQLVLLFRKKDQNSMTNSFLDFSERIRRDQGEVREKLENRLDKNLESIQKSLQGGLSESHKTLQNVAKSMGEVSEAQKNLKDLSQNILSLQDILTDKKSRGIFGEVQLNQILVASFGEGSKLFEIQKKLSNGKIVDSLLSLPKPLGNLPIDSKFPLENYLRLLEGEERADKTFKQDLKKHIDDIHSKYVQAEETSEYAMMFVPSEAIFSEVVVNHEEVLHYAYSKNIWLCSPTTMVATLTTIQSVMKNIEQFRHLDQSLKELKSLSVEFSRYNERWEDLRKRLDGLNSEFSKVEISANKISKKFSELN